MHYYSSKSLKRLRDKERQLDRLLTKLETLGQNFAMLVLSSWLVEALRHAGYRVGQRHHCKDGIYWYYIEWDERQN